MGRLSGKGAIITGAGSGIGRETAKLFAAEGARVAVLDINGASARETARNIERQSGWAVALEVDLADGAAAEAAVRGAASKLQRLDILVNNAATYVLHDFLDTTQAEWHKVLDTNLTAYFLCARTAARQMRQQGGGSIVNICSVHRAISEPRSGVYAASKAGVAQLTRNLAIEFAAHNIVVNSISPGFIRTAMSMQDGVDETATERFKKLYVESGRIPLGRAGLPEEVAHAALFFAARECGYLTGADLLVDGGLMTTL